LLRELHVYSKSLPLHEKPLFQEFQHRGIGKKLIEEAEKIALEEFDCNKLLVISGVGVIE
jgi:elongator complex protein 3